MEAVRALNGNVCSRPFFVRLGGSVHCALEKYSERRAAGNLSTPLAGQDQQLHYNAEIPALVGRYLPDRRLTQSKNRKAAKTSNIAGIQYWNWMPKTEKYVRNQFKNGLSIT
jgi:hypothetical protein